MNLVFVHRGGAALGAVSAVAVELGGQLRLLRSPTSVDEIVETMPTVVLVDAQDPHSQDMCRTLKHDERSSSIPLLLIDATGLTAIDGIPCDDVLTPTQFPEQLADRLRAWSTFQRRWERRLASRTEQVNLMIRRIAALARRARGVFGEQLVSDASAFGRYLGLGEADLRVLEDGARLHDFGDLTLPPMEAELAQALANYRPELSESLLAPVVGSRKLLALIRHQSERWDGAGYPDGLVGHSIPRLARILRILVAFDRSVRAGRSTAEAVAALAADVLDGASDPELHEAFVNWLELREDAHQVEA